MSGSDSDDTDDTAPEPRVKDLLTSKDVQQLMDWFHLPPPPAPEQPAVDDADFQKGLEEIEAMILPSMRRLGTRMEEHADRLRARRPPLELREWGKGMSKVNFEVRRAAEPVEAVIPHDIIEALDENAPQAMLRDLYRPETEFYIQYAPPWEGALDVLIDASAIVREAMSTHRVGPSYTPATRSLDASTAERRSLLASNWAEQGTRKDDWTPPVRRTRGSSR